MHAKGSPDHDAALAETIESMNEAFVSQGSYADLAYPAALTRRIADRILRESFEDRFRVLPAMRPMRAGDPAALRRNRVPRYPPLRGASMDDVELETENTAIAEEVGEVLAPKGILHAACLALRSKRMPADRAAELLFTVGVPTDLLAHVLGCSRDLEGRQAAGAMVHAACAATKTVAQARDALIAAHATKPWAPTVASATLRSDAGDAPHAAAMVSMARGDYLFGPGDGGALDHVRACIQAIAPTPIITLALNATRAAALLDAPNAHIVACEQAPAQFIRDAFAVLERESGSTLLLPRFPSRGEIGTQLADDLFPCELFALNQALRKVNPATNPEIRATHSPLHFHGGDILCWQDHDGAHVLIGEGTIARNTAMGLSDAQVRDAFAREFNAVELIVLPAATFHIDTCVSVVATPTGPAFVVADPFAAAALIIEEACERLRKQGVLSPANARAITSALARRNPPSNTIAFGLLASHVLEPLSASGTPPLALLLSPDDADGGTASALRFLHAADVVAALADAISAPPYIASYLNSIRRSFADLDALREILATRGPAHSLASGITGAHAVPAANMIHLDSGATLVPSFGGVCTRLDAASLRTVTSLARHPLPVPSSESAVRQGAVRCSLIPLI